MSEGIELLRRGHHAFSHDDFEALTEIVTEDVEWGASGRFPGQDVLYRGRDGVRDWMGSLKDAWETFEVQLADVVFDTAAASAWWRRFAGGDGPAAWR